MSLNVNCTNVVLLVLHFDSVFVYSTSLIVKHKKNKTKLKYVRLGQQLFDDKYEAWPQETTTTYDCKLLTAVDELVI